MINQYDNWLFHPEIYPNIKDDRVPDDFKPDYPEDTSFHEYDIGLIVYHPVNNRMRIHPYIHPSHRNRAKEIVMDSIGKMNCELEAKIPTYFRNVIIFALQCGFRKVKMIENDYLKNGKWYDSVLMVRP